jgi:hypothetical protein
VQFKHADQPLNEYLPGVHAVLFGIVDSVLGHTYPALQLEHAADPENEYWPAPQLIGLAVVEALLGHT